MMKTNVNSLKETARNLVKISKEKKLIKPHTAAFKEFPVENENHKGNSDFYKNN